MKKCASCSKDLPEAALHCVFCGAKQAPAPAVPASAVAKTAFGYSANDVMQHLGNQPPPAQPSYQPPPSRPSPGSQPPPVGAGYGSQQAAANAATMFVPGGGAAPPQQPYSPPQPQYGNNPSPGYGGSPGYGAPSPGYPAPSPGYGGGHGGGHEGPTARGPGVAGGFGGGMGIHSPQQPTPAPLPAVPQPYLGAQTGVAGRPIEPWKDSLKLVMIVFGAVALAAFATPLMTEPMAFNWDLIIDGPGKAKIPPLVWAGVGLLSIAFAAIPMVTLPRGALATVLGLAGAFTPFAVSASIGDPLKFLQFLGALVLVPGLLVRNEYTESLLARVLVTIGVVCTLVPYLVPDGGQIPLVQIFKALIEAGSHMEIVIVALLQIVLVVLCLLVWMPGPATAGAKYFAWAVILYPVVAVLLLALEDIADVITKTPGALLATVVPGMVYSVLIGYGGATVIGKQLE